MFDTKIAIILLDELEVWKKLNVTSFLMSGISGTQNIIGEEYIDKSLTRYLPMSRQPIMIFESDRENLKTLLRKSLTKDTVISIFTEELFQTFNDEDNRKKIQEFYTDDLNLVGIGLKGKKQHIDKLLKGYKLHP
ncbi:MAG: DUF2000 family protein [Streptococcus sp.]|nr:DUF2000 family protein [Streptococcus sp.]